VMARIGEYPPIWLRPGSTDAMMARQVLAENEYDFRLLRSPRLIVDAGANIGTSTIFFKTRYPDATVVAIEPEPSNFELLLRNTAALGCETLRAALWPEKTRVSLDYVHDAECAVMTRSSTPDFPLEAPTVTMGELIELYGEIDLLKLDIEGAERELFAEGAEEWLQSVQVIMIELHDRYVPGCSRTFHRCIGEFTDEAVRGENFCVAKPGWLAS